MQPTYTINLTMGSNTRSRLGDHPFPTKHPDQKRGHKTTSRAVDHPEDVQRSEDGVLNKISQGQVQAENIPNWETKIKQMLKEAQERSINKKLTTATKGAYHPLNTIQIPTTHTQMVLLRRTK